MYVRNCHNVDGSPRRDMRIFVGQKKKNCISETDHFDPLKSNSPLYKPHQKKPLQERNFFFFWKNSRNLSQLTLPYLGCRDSQGREDLRANLLLLYHFCHRVDTFRHQDLWIPTTFGKSITSLITSVTRMAMAMACTAMMTTKSKSGQNSIILVSKGIYSMAEMV